MFIHMSQDDKRVGRQAQNARFVFPSLRSLLITESTARSALSQQSFQLFLKRPFRWDAKKLTRQRQILLANTNFGPDVLRSERKWTPGKSKRMFLSKNDIVHTDQQRFIQDVFLVNEVIVDVTPQEKRQQIAILTLNRCRTINFKK